MKSLVSWFRGCRQKPKVGLVLSSGAAGGLAHIGVIKALKEYGIGIDVIAGSSIGAFIGACLAAQESIAELEELVLATDWRKLIALADFKPATLLKGFIQGQKVKDLLLPIIGDIDFSDLKIPLVVAATDVESGEGILIQEGSVLDAVRASISIPVIFTPVRLLNRYLIDGGIVNPIPLDGARLMGAEYFIVSNATHNPKRKSELRQAAGQPFIESPGEGEVIATVEEFEFKSPTADTESAQENVINQSQGKRLIDSIRQGIFSWAQVPEAETPDIFTVTLQSVYSMERAIALTQVKEADVLISPDVAGIDTLEFYRGKEAIAQGYEAAYKALSQRRIARRLASLRKRQLIARKSDA